MVIFVALYYIYDMEVKNFRCVWLKVIVQENIPKDTNVYLDPFPFIVLIYIYAC